MLERKLKLNVFISTLNFVLCFVGAQFVYSVFLPMQSNVDVIVSAVTVPYRYSAMIISLLVIVLNIRNRITFSHISKAFIIFWILFLIRMFFDLEINLHSFTNSQVTKQWLLTLGMVVIPSISVMLSYKEINLKKAFTTIYFILIFILGLSFFASENSINESDGNRLDMNAALGSLQLGLSAGTCILLSIKYFIDNEKIGKIIAITAVLMSIIVLLHAGSRGPFVSTIFIFMFYIFSKIKQKTVAFFALGISIILFFIFQNSIMQTIGEISPTMYKRLTKTIEEQDMSGREFIYGEALDLFAENPIVGRQFYLAKNYSEGFRYCHNIFLDSLISLGIFGGLLMLYLIVSCFKISNDTVKYKDSGFWVCLVLLLNIMFSMTSGAFYNNQLLTVLMLFSFLHFANKQLNV